MYALYRKSDYHITSYDRISWDSKRRTRKERERGSNHIRYNRRDTQREGMRTTESKMICGGMLLLLMLVCDIVCVQSIAFEPPPALCTADICFSPLPCIPGEEEGSVGEYLCINIYQSISLHTYNRKSAVCEEHKILLLIAYHDEMRGNCRSLVCIGTLSLSDRFTYVYVCAHYYS